MYIHFFFLVFAAASTRECHKGKAVLKGRENLEQTQDIYFKTECQ